LKKLFIARVRCLAFHLWDFTCHEWRYFTYYTPFFSDLLNSLLHQRNQQGVKFMMDAGVCFTKDLLLILCGIPDLVIISQLLSEAILSFHAAQEELETKRIISNLTKTVSLEPMPMSQNSKSSTDANVQSRDLAENVSMAHKIAEALTELPAGIKSQCCEALARSPLWRSLSTQDWPYYKEAFEVILQASNSDIDSSQALLWTAVKTRDAMGLHRLLDADLNCSAIALQDLLEEVIPWGDVEIFQRLINELTWIQNMESRYPDAYESRYPDAYGSRFMENAILHGNLVAVQKLFRAGIAVDFALSHGLGLAVSERQQEIVEFLLQCSADPNAESSYSYSHSTLLSGALASESVDIVRLLVRFGANPNDVEALCLASELNTTVLDTFVRACRKDFLVTRGVSVLFDAISNSELDTVQLLLRYGVDCNLLIDVEVGRQSQRKTCLAAAIEAGDCEILKLVIDTGVNINGVVEQSPKGLRTAFPQACTALVKAIRCQNLSAVDMLLEAGAEVNPTETSGSPVEFTPLQAAAEQGDLDLVQKLLDLGANANEEPYPYGGNTALQITASKGLVGVASLLLERGADVNAKGARKGGKTALETATENDRIDMVRFLVNSGAHITGPDAHQYWQARTLALVHGHFAVCKLLEALYEEKSGGQSSAQVLSSPDVDFDFSFSSRIPASYGLSDEPLGLTLIENFGEPNDGQSHSASSVESWAWPLSSILDFPLDGIPD
jgi:ankyrin repeat protein